MKGQKRSTFKASHAIHVLSFKNKKKKLEDLPNECILNVLSFLKLPDLIRCGLVSKRIRHVSFIESLWHKIDILNSDHSRKIVPTELVKRIINRGCKYLSLRGCKVTGKLKYSDFSLDSNYWNYQLFSTASTLSMDLTSQTHMVFDSSSDSSDSSDFFESKYRKRRRLVKQNKTKTEMVTSQLISLDLTQCHIEQHVMNILLTACHSLKKLTLRKVSLTPYMFQIICDRNGQTLQTLDLTATNGPGTNQRFLPHDMLLILNNCLLLKEIDFSGCRLSGNCVELLVNQLSPNIKKLTLGAFGMYILDEHIATLVSRCKRITSLNLAFKTNLTDISLTNIMENLKNLEELDITFLNITYAKLRELRLLPKLKTLNSSMAQEDYEELKKTVPQLTNHNLWRQKWANLVTKELYLTLDPNKSSFLDSDSDSDFDF